MENYFQKSDVEFNADGTKLRGWLYRPKSANGLIGIIVMSGGYATVKEMRLSQYAEAFVSEGFAVLLYDNRNFGGSDGEPRQEINPWQQIEDYKHAITFVSTLEGIDKNKIGIWGSSYSGGHVIVVAATDRRVKCVVTQVPTISGYQAALRRLPADKLPELFENFSKDRISRSKGEKATTLSVVADGSTKPSVYSAKAAIDFYLHLEFKPFFKNEVTLRSVEWARSYEPGIYIGRISPTPFLMIVAKDDSTTPTDLCLSAYEQALEPKKLVLMEGNHFDPYFANSEKSKSAAAAWFAQNLR
jgi:dienelactone hydrolase